MWKRPSLNRKATLKLKVDLVRTEITISFTKDLGLYFSEIIKAVQQLLIVALEVWMVRV